LLDKDVILKTKLRKLNLKASVTIKTDKLLKALTAINTIADNFIIKTYGNEAVVIEGESDIENIQAKFKKGDVEIESDENHRAMYPLEYMIPFAKLMKKLKVDEIVIQYATDYPMKVTFQIAGLLKGYYLLAPKIEEG